MVTFTRRHYELIGEMLRDLSQEEKIKWFDKWNTIFLNDNPRYQHDKFKEFVFEKDFEEYDRLAGKSSGY